MSLLLAVTALEKIQAVPARTWINVVLAMGAFILAVILVRKAAQMNKMVLAVIIFIALTVFGFQWIYERNEPKFMTPLVDKIAPFFPAKSSYGAKQQQAAPVR